MSWSLASQLDDLNRNAFITIMFSSDLSETVLKVVMFADEKDFRAGQEN